MNKCNWTYINTSGSHNKIGVLHDVKKGHFVIYCDKKIILADKEVFDTNLYTFFVDHELCKIKVERVGNKFAYEFIIDTKTTTPLNQARKKEDNKNILYSILTVGGIALLVGLFMIGGSMMNEHLRNKKLKEYGVKTIAFIRMVEADQKYQYYYEFGDSINHYYYLYKAYEQKNPVLLNGFPLKINDEFQVLYASIDPKVNRLEVSEPSENQLNRYQELARQEYQTFYPMYNVAYCDCVLDIAKTQKGVEGLALFYHLTTLPAESKRYNKIEYEKYIETDAFLDAEVDCWQLK